MARVIVIVVLALAVSWLLWGGRRPAAKPTSKRVKRVISTLYLDGKKERVRWSDGDTFKIVSGPKRGLKARLQGFNTLESYGPVHRWGTWQASELAQNADQATAAVQKDGWKCVSRGKKDRYNRQLVACPGLCKHLVAKGLAHIFGTPKGKRAHLLGVQAQAIKAKRGMWAKGAPPYLLTSVHSIHEGQNPAYNRLVSTKDGSFILQKHRKRYKTCQWVCAKGACLLYVPYRRRYGWKRARCLR